MSPDDVCSNRKCGHARKDHYPPFGPEAWQKNCLKCEECDGFWP